MLELIQEEREVVSPSTVEIELTVAEVEETLEKIADIQAKIAAAQKRLDELTAYHERKIERAQDIFEQETQPLKTQKAELEGILERYAKTQGKRTLKFPSGELSFRKQQPLFFINGEKVTNDNPAIIALARSLNLIRTKETADWAALKNRLEVDGEHVFLAQTGEVVKGMWARQRPDKFTVTAL